jgi:tetratricopeptide (TPR) repeat protein
MRYVSLVLAVLATSCAAPGGSARRDAALSPEEAQRAFEEGRAAAKSGDYTRAVTLLSRAQRAAPYDPDRLFHLGLAHAGAGHETSAIAWLETYLATSPQPLNATEAREEIARLQEKAVAKLNKLLEHALASAERLDRTDRKESVSLIGWYYGMSGDLDRAQRLYDSVSARPREAWRTRIELFKSARDFLGVEQFAAAAKEDERDEIWLDAAFSWSSSEGSVDLAQAAVAKVSEKHRDKIGMTDRVRSQTLLRDVRLGKVPPDTSLRWSVKQDVGHVIHAGIVKLLSQGKIPEARELGELIPDTGPRSRAFTDIAVRQLEGGDPAGARASARKAMTASRSDCEKPAPAAILGQVDLAQKLLANDKNWDSSSGNDYMHFLRLDAQGAVAYVQALSGDLAGAEATARASVTRTARFDLPPWGYRDLGRFHARKGRLREAFETVQRAPASVQGDILEEIAGRMMTQGDLAGAEEVLLSIPTQDDVPYRKMLANWRLDVRRQIGGLAQLAATHRARNALDQEARILRLASTVVLRSPYFCDEEVSAVLAKIARRQEEWNDAEGLAATRRLLVSKELRRWTELAYELDGRTVGYFGTIDLDADLKKAAEANPVDLARFVAVAAHRCLQQPLAMIEARRRNP